jgi:DNA-3-methyladenine glycosylase
VPVPWGVTPPQGGGFAPDFFRRPVAEVARALLGARLVSTVGGRLTSGVIVETEAYGGPDDPASHAATVRGRTERNSAMYGPPGRAYVYRIYGMHWCVNVVTGPEGDPQAVLIRGLEPLEGVDVMAHRRSDRRPLTAGPGRLCEALGISSDHYGHDLCLPPLRLERGWAVPDGAVGASGRVGVRAAADLPLRFYVLGSAGVSRG